MELGKRIKKIRMQQGRTLQEIADKCGFSKSLLSKIEGDKTSPPVATLTKIAGALGGSVSSLLETPKESGTIFIPADHSSELTSTSVGYSFFSFAGERLEKKILPFLFVAEKGKIKDEPLCHCGEEFVYVLEGKMKYQVGKIQYTLGPGDSLYFDALEEHHFQPISTTVKYLGVFSADKEKKK